MLLTNEVTSGNFYTDESNVTGWTIQIDGFDSAKIKESFETLFDNGEFMPLSDTEQLKASAIMCRLEGNYDHHAISEAPFVKKEIAERKRAEILSMESARKNAPTAK